MSSAARLRSRCSSGQQYDQPGTRQHRLNRLIGACSPSASSGTSGVADASSVNISRTRSSRSRTSSSSIHGRLQRHGVDERNAARLPAWLARALAPASRRSRADPRQPWSSTFKAAKMTSVLTPRAIAVSASARARGMWISSLAPPCERDPLRGRCRDSRGRFALARSVRQKAVCFSKAGPANHRPALPDREVAVGDGERLGVARQGPSRRRRRAPTAPSRTGRNHHR